MNVRDVVIYGTGSIGSVLATFLRLTDSENQINIHLVGREYVLNKFKTDGLIFIPYKCENEDQWIKTSNYLFYTDIKQVPRADVIFITMKAHSLEGSLKEAKHLLTDNPVLFLTMNGLGLSEIVSNYVPLENIIECVVFFPSRLENNKVINTGGNATFLAEKNEVSSKLIPNLFDINQLDFQVIKNFKQKQWQKAVTNIGMNAISAITMKTVGGVLDTPPLRKIITELIKETIIIAKKEGIILSNDMIEQFWEFCSRDPNHRPSTQQDILKKRPTETVFLNGHVVKKGREYGLSTPVNQAIVSLMKIIEDYS